jgi:ABC-type multidrug transport system fused ATPase/permease subunit
MAKQRQVRVEQKSAMAAMAQLELRSDEELAAETKHRAAAQAILGARASERYDSARAREHFRKAIAAARPQERMQLRRMAEASLALAERRPDDLKAAVEKLGQQAPSSRQLFILRVMGMISPAPGASLVQKARGVAILVGIVVALLVIGFLVATLVLLPFGGGGTLGTAGLGIVVVLVALVVLSLVGRRRQAAAKAKAKAKSQPPTKARSARPGG